MSTIAPAKLVSQKSYQVASKLKITERFFDVPLDYSKPNGETLRVFGRRARKHETAIVPDASKDKDQLPWMCYLQGGPGCECRPPQHFPFIHAVLDRGYELFFLDQRGTGLSTPITAATLQMQGDSDAQAKYLHLFRADSIVKDCEAIRQALTANYPEEKKKWSTMGQSFGGFCTITYLSFFPQGLRESFLFGGLQPLVKEPDEVYRRLYKKVMQRNEVYYAKFPEDVARVKTIMNYLQHPSDGKVKLPSGGSLTRRRFASLGISLGFHGGIDSIHDIVLKAAFDLETFGYLTRPTLSAIDNGSSFDERILYALFQEIIYCSGHASRWSAHRLLNEFSAFSLDKTDDSPIYFTGEMVYPWIVDDLAEMRPIRDAAHKIAESADWPALFDEQQLAKNEVPVYAASYVEDMYVDFDLSMATARKIKGCKVFTTNVMFHDAVRSKMDEVVKQAFALRDDVID